jgi:hypothetical protein
VSSRTHTQLEEEDPEDEGAEAEGGSDREGKRCALQRYSSYDPDKARMEGEEEDQHAYTHNHYTFEVTMTGGQFLGYLSMAALPPT